MSERDWADRVTDYIGIQMAAISERNGKDRESGAEEMRIFLAASLRGIYLCGQQSIEPSTDHLMESRQ